jgi:hypothetical protein
LRWFTSALSTQEPLKINSAIAIHQVPQKGDLVEWLSITKFILMILINRTLSDGQIKPILHKGDNPERAGEIVTNKELHEFGLALLIAYLYRQKGELIRSNGNIGNEYPHLIAKNPKGELLYIWVKTEMYPTIPSIISIENHEEVIKLSNQFDAIPVFAGIRSKCVSTEKNVIPVYGAGYVAEFTGFKAF